MVDPLAFDPQNERSAEALPEPHIPFEAATVS
jgi:hypothetical protein